MLLIIVLNLPSGVPTTTIEITTNDSCKFTDMDPKHMTPDSHIQDKGEEHPCTVPYNHDGTLDTH